MRIFSTKELQQYFESETLTNIRACSQLLDGDVAATSGQSELYGRDDTLKFSFCWIGIRTSKAGRLVIGVVKNKDTGEKCAFCLEYTPVHDYGKTLVENHGKRKSWISLLSATLLEGKLSEKTEEAVSFEEGASQVILHSGLFRQASKAQRGLLENARIGSGAICFGSPGSGKTLVGVQKARDYLHDGLTVFFIVPTERLGEKVNQEFDGEQSLQCWSLRRFLREMDKRYPAQGLVYKKEEKNEHGTLRDTRTEVNFDYFVLWCQKHKVEKHTKKYDLRLLWSECCHVLMQANFLISAQIFLNIETYLSLGERQSYIQKTERDSLYHDIFAPFLNSTMDDTQFYCSIRRARALYWCLSRDKGRDETEMNESLILDEVQKLHSWELGSILLSRHDALKRGQFCIFGDAHQGVEHQALRLAASLRHCLEHHGIGNYQWFDLNKTHRSSQSVARFVAQVHATELAVVGSIERDTHISTKVNESQAEGELALATYSDALRMRVENDVGAYVLVPDVSCLEEAKTYWPESQIVVLKDFQGLSAFFIVMYGFSAFYQRELKCIHAQLSSTESKPIWTSQVEFARKTTDDDAHKKRTALQALYTGASRAEGILMLVEQRSVHPAIEEMYRSVQMTATAVIAAATVVTITKQSHYTKEEWFIRGKTDYLNGLQEQALSLFARVDIWGEVAVHEVKALFEESHQDSNVLLERLREILIVGKRVASGVKSEAVAKSPSPVARATATDDIDLSAAQIKYIETLFRVATKETLQSFFEKEMSKPAWEGRFKTVCFIHQMENRFSLFENLVLSKRSAMLRDALKASGQEEYFNRAYAKLENNHFLRWIWERYLKSKNTEPKAHAIPDKVVLSELLKRQAGCSFFMEQEMLAQQSVLTLLLKPLTEDDSLLRRLLENSRDPDAVAQALIKRGALQSICPVMHLGPPGSKTPFFYFIVRILASCYATNEDWLFWKEHLTPQNMHRVITEEGPNQGKSPLYFLLNSSAGLALLRSHFSELKTLLMPAAMHQIVTGKGPDQGKSPLYFLLGLPEGLALLEARFDELKSLLTAAAMHRTVTGKGAHEGMTLLYFLLGLPEGLALLDARFDELKALLTPAAMHQIVTVEGALKGSCPLYFLLSSPRGLALLDARFHELKVLLTPAIMHQIVTIEGANKGKSLLSCLSGSPIGQALLQQHQHDPVVRELLVTSSPIGRNTLFRPPAPTMASSTFARCSEIDFGG